MHPAQEAGVFEMAVKGFLRSVASVWDQLHRSVIALRRSPRFSVPALLSLALGFGLSASVYSLAETVMLRPLPYTRPEELLTVGWVDSVHGSRSEPHWDASTVGDYRGWQAAMGLQSLALIVSTFRVVKGDGAAEYVRGAEATPTLSMVLGASPHRGRWFAEGEVRVVVIAQQLADRQFGVGVDPIGRTMLLNGEANTVIGVVLDEFGLIGGPEFWVPLRGRTGQLIARLRPKTPAKQVQFELEALSESRTNARALGFARTLVTLPLRDQLFGTPKVAMKLLSVAAGMMMLLACANVANLALARVIDRRREFAVRTALGARTRALASMVLAENLVLCFLAALLGLFVAAWGGDVIRHLASPELVVAARGQSSSGAILFLIALASIATVGISLAPVIAAGDTSVYRLLGQSTGVGRAPGLALLQRTLVCAQFATALALTSGVVLLSRSIARLGGHGHLGFSADGIVVASVRLFGERYRSGDMRDRFIRDLSDRVAVLPGVQSLGFGPPPLVGGRGDLLREGFSSLFTFADSSAGGLRMATVWVKHVDPGYLPTLGIRLREGRMLRAGDDRFVGPVAIVNAAAANLFFGSGVALGRKLPVALSGSSTQHVEVVGVVDDALQRDVTLLANPEVLLPVAQQDPPSGLPSLIVRTRTPAATIRALHQALRAADPELAATRLERLQTIVDRSLSRHTFIRLLMSLFATLGLTVASVGLYAVTAFLVASRTREIGLRLALGAQRSQVLGLVLADSFRVVGLGIVVGLPVAFLVGHGLQAYLFEVGSADVLTGVIVLALLTAAAFAATIVPAARAAAVDPAASLRADHPYN